MQLQFLTGSKEEMDTAIAAPNGQISPDDYYTEYLEEADRRREDCIRFRSITPLSRQSDNFSLIGSILHAVIKHSKKAPHPQLIQFICDSDETARLYKVVYNFWYAADKTSRMEDTAWK